MNTKRFAAICLTGALAVSMMTGCALNKNATVATMENVEVKLGTANFMCRYQQAASDENFRAYFGEDVWNQDLYGNGSTMQESVKEQIMANLHDLYTLKQHMAEYNISITEEDEEAIRQAAAAFMRDNSADALEELGATEEIVEEVLTLYTIQSRMRDAIRAEADTNVSDEEANMRAYTMVKFDLTGYYDDNYNYVSYTEEEVEQRKSDAQKLAEAVKDPAELEDKAKEAGYTATTGTYDADNTGLDKEVKAALDKLQEGGLSDLITTDSAVYIVRLDKETDEEATEKNREAIIEARKSAKYEEVLNKWQEGDGWSVKESALAKIEFKNMFITTPETEAASDTESGSESESQTEPTTETETE